MTPEQIANLPFQVLLVFAVIALWRAYTNAQDARVNDLKQVYEKGLTDVRNRVMMIEDRLGIKPPLMDDSVVQVKKLS